MKINGKSVAATSKISILHEAITMPASQIKKLSWMKRSHRHHHKSGMVLEISFTNRVDGIALNGTLVTPFHQSATVITDDVKIILSGSGWSTLWNFIKNQHLHEATPVASIDRMVLPREDALSSRNICQRMNVFDNTLGTCFYYFCFFFHAL